ncbi:alpha/beta hydrolase [Sphingobium sufflavum]|uniref:alpha/beta hydrolase n=1 Tax=Sphingobium sufflavum TaxID=1129547 RepID=UPI001F23BAC8|nr:alpha/beta hydrolase [Sphingobium sufflavum]MCE7797070.1 alpha/beta hydrolase [Sphingobium sufflavum]
MKLKPSILFCSAIVHIGLFVGPAFAKVAERQAEIVRIWPGAAPGTEDWTGPETDTPLQLPGLPIYHMVSNVTTPTLTVVRPAPGTANRTAMLVCPGGGFQDLAVTHEGELVAKWLAERGITAFVLKYRVRKTGLFRVPADIRRHPERFAELLRSTEPNRPIALADGLQAMRFIRANADRYGIVPNRVGMIGFSAGAILTMDVTTNAPAVDRPNFAVPIYGALEGKEPPVGGPPLFIAATQDDNAVPAAESVNIYSRWTAANLPAELHVYQQGGHGFGMVPHKLPVDGWSVAFEAWLKAGGWLGAAKTAAQSAGQSTQK